MNRFVSVGLISLALLLSACQSVTYRPLDQEERASRDAHQQPETPPKPTEAEQRAKARKLVDQAEAFLKDRQPSKARPIISTLQQQSYFADDVRLLDEECSRQEARASEIDRPVVSDTRAIDEVRDRLVLPRTYGETRVISPDLDPLEMPTGPMEEILRRRIRSINLTDATLPDILEALGQTEGLNIIADQALSSDATLTIKGKDMPIYEVLSYVSRNMGIAFYLGENVIWVTAAPAVEPGPKMETRVYQLRKGYIPSEANSGGGFGDDDDDNGGGGRASSQSGSGGNDDLYDALVDFLEDNPDNPADSKFEIYRNRNLLVIRNTRENLRLAEEIIRKFDEIPQQVLIEARFIEISQNDLTQVGVELGGTDSNGTAIPITGRFGADGATNAAFDSILGGLQNKQRGNLRLSGTLDSLSYNILLQALQEKKSARNLSAPRVTVLNNQPANLRKGRTIQYFRTFTASDVTVNNNTGTTETINTNAVVDGEAEELQLGIAIGVVPSISNDGQEITLSLDTSIKDLIQFRTENNVQLPETSDSELKTVVTVGSSETVVLGGLITSTQGHTVNKIPILGDLPLIGFLFRKKEVQDDPSHLLIFVTATIVDREGRYNRTPAQP